MSTAESLVARYGTMFHSDLQIGAFIVDRGGCGHPYGMFNQAMREIAVRVEGSALAEENLARLRIKERAAFRASRRWSLTPSGRDKRELARLELRALRRQLDGHVREQGERERELRAFVSHATQLLRLLGNLTTTRRAQLDCEYWIHKLRHKLALDILTEGRPSAALLELLPSLPVQMRAEIADHFQPENWNKAPEWFLSLKPIPLDALPTPRPEITG